MSKKDQMWVISGTGKGIHLVDLSTDDPENPVEAFAMKITDEMAEKKIPVKVPTNTFFSGHCKIGNIVQVESPKPKVEKVIESISKPRGRKPKEPDKEESE